MIDRGGSWFLVPRFSFRKCSVNSTTCLTMAERIVLSVIFAKILGKSPKRYWRREWDSNPRYGFPYTRFPSVLLQPLGHLSVFRINDLRVVTKDYRTRQQRQAINVDQVSNEQFAATAGTSPLESCQTVDRARSQAAFQCCPGNAARSARRQRRPGQRTMAGRHYALSGGALPHVIFQATSCKKSPALLY